MQIAQIAQMESPTMTSTSERLARIRSDFARLHAAWFGDLMTLRRDGVLEHTWRPGRDDPDAEAPPSPTTQCENAYRLDRAA